MRTEEEEGGGWKCERDKLMHTRVVAHIHRYTLYIRTFTRRGVNVRQKPDKRIYTKVRVGGTIFQKVTRNRHSTPRTDGKPTLLIITRLYWECAEQALDSPKYHSNSRTVAKLFRSGDLAQFGTRLTDFPANTMLLLRSSQFSRTLHTHFFLPSSF